MMSYIVIGEYKFKGIARDGEKMQLKIEKVLSLWEIGTYTPRGVATKVNLDTRTTQNVLRAYHLL